MTLSADERIMAAALRLAGHHLGQTSTNPSVGCLILRDGAIIGRGVTAQGGRPHAETIALAEAGDAARGATAYVTLEPCSHVGKTPPCADALIRAGIARVVVSVTDPDPRVNGQGLARLAAAGIDVVTGVLEDEGRRSLEAYLMRKQAHRPFVTLKLALSQDGMIGKAGAGQVAITGPVSRGQVHVLRATSDAILIGIGTALADDPALTCRLPGLGRRSPHRFVIDPDLALPSTSTLAATAAETPVTLLARVEGSADRDWQARRMALESSGVRVMVTDCRQPAQFLPLMAEEGISSLIVEGGARTAQLFLAADLVDRIMLLTGPDVIGEGGLAAPLSPSHMAEGFQLADRLTFGQDLCRIYERKS